jgi:hypothetical protein
MTLIFEAIREIQENERIRIVWKKLIVRHRWSSLIMPETNAKYNKIGIILLLIPSMLAFIFLYVHVCFHGNV